MIITKTDIQIRFADVDSLGHVNNVNLQHYFDLGKSDFFLAAFGIDRVDGTMGLITAATSTSYLDQTRLKDNVYVQTELRTIGSKSITISQNLINHANKTLLAESTSVMVAFNFVTQESVLVPDKWRKALND